jgi:alkylation response protein AidB-like acyl-CoA dehydrogenase
MSTPGAVVWAILDRDRYDAERRTGVDTTRGVATIVVGRQSIGPDDQLHGDDESGNVGRSLAASLVAAECVGGAAWCVDTAADYAKVRVQFGRPIGQFQAVKHRCADMLLRLEQARAAVWDAVRGGAREEAQLARAAAAELARVAFFDDAKDCVQVLGGIGYTWEHDAHIFLKRALSLHQLLDAHPAFGQRVVDLALSGVATGC